MTAKFQQRHYEAIASIMQECKPSSENVVGMVTWEKLRSKLVLEFVQDNDNFHASRFQAACEPGANVRARKAS